MERILDMVAFLVSIGSKPIPYIFAGAVAGMLFEHLEAFPDGGVAFGMTALLAGSISLMMMPPFPDVRGVGHHHRHRQRRRVHRHGLRPHGHRLRRRRDHGCRPRMVRRCVGRRRARRVGRVVRRPLVGSGAVGVVGAARSGVAGAGLLDALRRAPRLVVGAHSERVSALTPIRTEALAAEGVEDGEGVDAEEPSGEEADDEADDEADAREQRDFQRSPLFRRAASRSSFPF